MAKTSQFDLTASSLLFTGLAAFAGYAHATTTFEFTGAEQSYVVPPGVTSLAVEVRGAAGANGEPLDGSINNGGRGAMVTAVIPVSPGEVLAVYVGGTPQAPNWTPAGGLGESTGGFNGGGPAGRRIFDFDTVKSPSIGGGGGASDIRQGGSTLAHRIVIAGGGGGGGRGNNLGRGGEGGNAGLTGSPGTSRSPSGGGGGASQTEGGSAGLNLSVAGGFQEVLPTVGTLGEGGGGGLGAVEGDANPSGSERSFAGGGGGGGLFGGGGGGGVTVGLGGSSGGGGGSSYVFPAASQVTVSTGNRMTGKVTISPHATVSTEEELRQAILADATVETITILSDITLTQDLPAVEKEFHIRGGNHVLDGAGLYRLFSAQNGTLTIHDLELTRGNVVAGNGGTAGLIEGTFVLSDGANLRFNRSDAVAFDGAISGVGSVTQAGSGSLTLTGTNTFTGKLTIEAGTVIVSSKPGVVSAPGTIVADVVNNGSLVFSPGSASYAFAGAISGPGSVSIAGQVQLTGANTYSGGTRFLSEITPAVLGSFRPPLLLTGGRLSWPANDLTDVSALDFKIAVGALYVTDTVRFANSISDESAGRISKYGSGTLVLAATEAFDGHILIEDGSIELEPGATLPFGSVTLESSGASLSVSEGNVIGSLKWSSTGSLRVPIGAASTPLAITGELAAPQLSGPNFPRIDLIDKGAVPGKTYTLATFGSTNLIADQVTQQLSVIGLPGTLTVESHALKFTVAPEPALRNVAVSVAKHKNRAVYTIRNTGDTGTTFRLRAASTITNATGGTKFSGRRVAIAVTYHRDGKNITSAMKARTATVALAPGGTARITAQLHVRGGNAPVAQRFVTSKLTAKAEGDASISDSAGARILAVPARK